MSVRGQQVWRWPLWSWKHLTITAAAVAVVLVCLGRLQSSATPGDATKPTSSSASASVSPDVEPSVKRSWSSPTASPSPSAASTPQASADPRVVAAAFLAFWARSYDPAPEWRARLVPMATPKFAGVLAKTDPMRVPATAVVGDGVVSARSADSATIRHTTDNGPVLVTLSRTGQRWLVRGVAPDEAGAVP